MLWFEVVELRMDAKGENVEVAERTIYLLPLYVHTPLLHMWLVADVAGCPLTSQLDPCTRRDARVVNGAE